MSTTTSTVKKIAMLLANGFNEAEFVALQKAIMAKQAQARIISPNNGLAYSNPKTGNVISYASDSQLSETLAIDYDCLIVVGGQEHIDLLTEEPHAIRLMRAFLRESIPILLVSESSKLLDVIGDTRLSSAVSAEKTSFQEGCVFWSVDGTGLSALFRSFFETVCAKEQEQISDSDNGVAA
mgnify:FL=1